MNRFRCALLSVASIAAAVIPLTPTTRAAAATAVSPSWTVSTGSTGWNSPNWGNQPFAGAAVGDLRGDGNQEVVTGFPNGVLYTIDATGHVLWTRQLGAAIDTTPTLADLHGDGRREILVTSQDGRLYVFDANGNLLPGWPQTAFYGGAVTHGIFVTAFLGGVAVGDVFNNGRQYVVAAGLDHFVYEWDADGNLQPGFPVNMWDTSVATPALADLDHNGQLWIIAGGDSVPGRPGTANWYAIPPTGCAHPDDTIHGCDHVGWPRNQNEVPWSSPAAGDVFGNGSTSTVLGTGHYYSQVNGPPTRGNYLNVAAPNGATQATLFTDHDLYSSPALGDLGGPNLNVAVSSEAGTLYSWNPSTGASWRRGGFTALASPSIAPVDGSGGNGVWGPGLGSTWGFDRNGNAILQALLPGAGAAFAAPAVADLGSGRLSMLQTSVQNVDPSHVNYSVSAFAIPGTNGTMPARAWATFHGNNQRSGQLPPMATAPRVNGGGLVTHTDLTLSWGVQPGPAATSFDVWVNEPSLGWELYSRTPATSIQFTGLPGHTYSFFVDARNQLGSSDLRKVAQASASIPGGATHSSALPFSGMYAMQSFGRVTGAASPVLPPAGPLWPGWQIARAASVDPANAQSGQLLDGWGGIHPFGSAPQVAPGGYWPGWGITRDIAVERGSGGGRGYVLDGFGGIHPFGGAPAVALTGYWPGWDIAHRLALIPGTNSGYTLDGWGGLHPFGGASPIAPGGYWPGWDIARGIAICPGGGGGYTLDGWGGLHGFGNQAGNGVSHLGYWPGWDIARGLVITGSDCRSGYTLDGWGGIHPWDSNGAGGTSTSPIVDQPWYTPGQDTFRSLTAG